MISEQNQFIGLATGVLLLTAVGALGPACTGSPTEPRSSNLSSSVEACPVVLTPSSGGSITDGSGNTWTLTAAGDIDEDGAPVPGGGGTSALTYVAATQVIWGQDANSGTWYWWDGSYWNGPSTTNPVSGCGDDAGGGGQDSGGGGQDSGGGGQDSGGGGEDSGGGEQDAGGGGQDAGPGIDSGGGGPSPTFQDNFQSLSLHEYVQPGDTWALISPSTPDGRGGPNDDEQGDQWWANPFNPATPIQGLYTDPGGQLLLGLLPTPPASASYISSQSGTNLPYVGTLMNSTPSMYQLFGYFEVGVAVDNLPGFAFQACLESWEISHSWPPEIDIRIQTDGSGNQSVLLEVDTTSGGIPTTIAMDATGMHAYGIDWESDFITFYIDRNQVFQVPTPTDGTYTSYPAYWYLLTGANYINLGVDPDPGSLPVYAHVGSVTAWASRPF